MTLETAERDKGTGIIALSQERPRKMLSQQLRTAYRNGNSAFCHDTSGHGRDWVTTEKCCRWRAYFYYELVMDKTGWSARGRQCRVHLFWGIFLPCICDHDPSCKDCDFDTEFRAHAVHLSSCFNLTKITSGRV